MPRVHRHAQVHPPIHRHIIYSMVVGAIQPDTTTGTACATEKYHLRTQLTEVSNYHGVSCLRGRARLVQHGGTNAPAPARAVFACATHSRADVCPVNRRWRVWHQTRVRPTDCIGRTSEAGHGKEKWHEDVACMAILQQE